jgi:hypothetical protein
LSLSHDLQKEKSSDRICLRLWKENPKKEKNGTKEPVVVVVVEDEVDVERR